MSVSVPEPVDSSTINVQPLEQDSSALVVKFSLPCGKYLNYEHGRPHQYSIGVERYDGPCKEICSRIGRLFFHCYVCLPHPNFLLLVLHLLLLGVVSDAEVKVPFAENPDLKSSRFWSSVEHT